MNDNTQTNATTNLPFSVMLGREDEMRLLRDAFHEAAQSNQTQIVTLLGESGWGKTRLLTELYAELAREHGQGYWPESLCKDPNTMRLNPQTQDFQWAEQGTSPPGFYWWGIRFAKPDQRNSNALGSELQVASQSLLPHLLFAEHAKLVSETRKSKLDLGIDIVIDVGTALFNTTLPFVGLLKPLLTHYNERRKRKLEIEKIQHAMSDASAAELAQHQDTTDRLLLGVDALINRAASGKAESSRKIPFVICLDDAHWLDSHTASFISGLLAKAQENKWPVLLLITAWPSEWHQCRAVVTNAQCQSFFQALDNHQASTVASLAPCSEIDQLIASELPGLPLQQRTLIASIAGPDLYGLHGLLSNLKARKKRFIQGNVNGRLTDSAVKELEKLGPVRQEVARERLLNLPKQQQEMLGILSFLGATFIQGLGQELLEQLQADGWVGLSNINIAQELAQIKDHHRYLQQSSSNAVAFVDEVKQEAAQELMLDDPAEVITIKVALLSVINRWLEKAMFDELSHLELPVFFDNVQWALDPADDPGSTQSSLQTMINWRLDVLQDIFAGLHSFRQKNTTNYSGTHVLDISAFRAGLPFWWQAKWLLHQSEITNQAALETFDGLLQAAEEILLKATAELATNADWKVAEAAGNAATALVSLTWSCLNQAPINGFVVNERELLLRTKSVLQSCFEKVNITDSISNCFVVVLLIEISEINRGIDKHQQALSFKQATTELTQLIRSDKWENSHAEFLFKRVFVDVLFADFFDLEMRAAIKPVADALVAMTRTHPLKELGNFQLVTLGLAYQSLYWLSHVANQPSLLDDSIECCLELIHRGLGGIVASHCWLGDSKVKQAAMLDKSLDPDEVPLEQRRTLAWRVVSSLLTRVFDEEALIPPNALFEICKNTLKPYAALFFEPWQVKPGDLASFVKQVNGISPNSCDMLLTSACYAWYNAAERQAGSRPDSNDSNWVIHQLEAIKAMRLIPAQMVSVTKDYQRGMKLEMPFFDAIKGAKTALPSVRSMGSMVVAAIDCKDFYTPQDFSNVVWNLIAQFFLRTSSKIASNPLDVQEVQIKEHADLLMKSFKPDTGALSPQVMDDLMAFKQLVLALIDPMKDGS